MRWLSLLQALLRRGRCRQHSPCKRQERSHRVSRRRHTCQPVSRANSQGCRQACRLRACRDRHRCLHRACRHRGPRPLSPDSRRRRWHTWPETVVGEVLMLPAERVRKSIGRCGRDTPMLANGCWRRGRASHAHRRSWTSGIALRSLTCAWLRPSGQAPPAWRPLCSRTCLRPSGQAPPAWRPLCNRTMCLSPC